MTIYQRNNCFRVDKMTPLLLPLTSKTPLCLGRIPFRRQTLYVRQIFLHHGNWQCTHLALCLMFLMAASIISTVVMHRLCTRVLSVSDSKPKNSCQLCSETSQHLSVRAILIFIWLYQVFKYVRFHNYIVMKSCLTPKIDPGCVPNTVLVCISAQNSPKMECGLTETSNFQLTLYLWGSWSGVMAFVC